jgi:hypothetical protein
VSKDEKIVVSQNFVMFLSPGTFMAEQTEEEVEAWDVEAACRRANEIVERHRARPYGFLFITRGRSAKELNSREITRSPFYFINCRVETREEIEARNDPRESTVRANMRINDIKAIARPKSGWDGFFPIRDGDVVLVFELADPAP